MKTATAHEFKSAGPDSKFPHTGPVAYGYGSRPYAAALKGVELKSANGRVRLFKTNANARAAVLKAAGADAAAEYFKTYGAAS